MKRIARTLAILFLSSLSALIIRSLIKALSYAFLSRAHKAIRYSTSRAGTQKVVLAMAIILKMLSTAGQDRVQAILCRGLFLTILTETTAYPTGLWRMPLTYA